MDITSIKLSVLVIVVLYKELGVSGQGVTGDGQQSSDQCDSIGYMIRNCTQSPDYRLIDNMPIVLNATEIKSFCINKDTTLSCIQNHLTTCQDSLVGVSSIIYDTNVFNTTYNTLCDNMELMWWSETSCILQLDSRLRECRWKKDAILADVQSTGSPAIYCRSLDELYACNTYAPDSLCIKTYSDFLTGYYRGMLTPSVCDDHLPRSQHVSYRTSGNVLTTPVHGVSSGVTCKLCYRIYLIWCVLYVCCFRLIISL